MLTQLQESPQNAKSHLKRHHLTMGSVRVVPYKDVTLWGSDLTPIELRIRCHFTTIRTEYLQNTINKRLFSINCQKKMHIITICQIPNLIHEVHP